MPDLDHSQLIEQLRQEKEQAETLVQELTDINQQIYERNLQVERELYTTRQLQQSLLPPIIETPHQQEVGIAKLHFLNDTLRIMGVYLPCDALGGDLYDVIPFEGRPGLEDAVGVTVADVSGHGVPAGFITAIFKAALYRSTLNTIAPGEVLGRLNNALSEVVKTSDYVTAVYCYLYNNYKTLSYSGAGHPYPLHYIAKSNTVELLNANSMPLVWMPNNEYPTAEVTLNPGDKVLLYSDGVTDMMNPQGDRLEQEGLQALFEKHIQAAQSNPKLLPLDTLSQDLSEFTNGTMLPDDVSLVLIEKL